jgi:uncharacterized protein (TIGR03437 family)
MPGILARLAVCAFVPAVTPAVLLAQQSRVAGPIDDARRVILPGSVHAKAQPSYDQGPADPSLRMPFITLTMKPSATQQADLERFLDQQLDQSSPNYHRWLTPEQFGDRFSLTPADYAVVVSWLQSHHLHIEAVARARNWVACSGAARDVELAFHTRVHRYLVDGQAHIANATDVSIPAVLQDLIGGIRGLDDFWRLPPSATPYNTSGSGVTQLAPGDWATIYDVSPLYAMGIDGTGQRIGIVGRSDMDQSYIDSFRSQFGLPPTMIEQHLVGPDPGITNAASEAALDLEWSGAIARGATIVYIYAGNFNDAVQAAIDQNLATVLSESFGTCEPQSAVGNRLMAQQANAQGITWVASSGDSGAAGCDPHGFFNTVGNATTVSDGPAVSAPASFPEVTAVGGTQFNEGTGNYWSSTNNANGGSALSYIPEVVWNETGAGGLLASGGGASIYFSKPAWQAGPGVPADNARDVPDVSFSAAGNHDPYMVVNVNGERATGGTSASAPSFAGVIALLNHYLVSQGAQAQPGLGNINPELYRLAGATTNVFHDITQGNNMVPCVAGSPDCVDGMLGFAAGPGYDLATGLGSIDVYNLVTQWNSPAAGTSTSLAASPSSIAFGGSVQLTATVTPVVNNSAVPGGTVTFSTGQTVLGIAPLVTTGGVALATLTVTGPLLPAGNAIVAATYSGDAVFNPSTGFTAVAVSAGPGGSFVSVNITPNPAQAGQVIRVSLTEQAGVGTTITGWTINGDNEFSLFAQDFGSTILPAYGTLFTDITSTPFPGTRVYVFTGVDADGRTWSQQYTLILEGVFQAPALKNVGSAADGFIATLAPNSIAAAYGNNLAPATENVTTLPLPFTVQGTTLFLEDSAGNLEAAPILFVSGGAPDQVNFLVPSDLAAGPATVIVTAQDGTISQGTTNIAPVSPGMFQLNASGLAAAYVFDATTNTTSNVYQLSGGQIVPLPISIPASDSVFLELFGTGLRAAAQANVTVAIGTTNVAVSYAGAQGSYEGLDQVNVALPPSLQGSGDVVVQVTANGIAANPVHVTIQ